MNGRICKRLRKMLNGADTEVTKRLYRRLKKEYAKQPNIEKSNWANKIEKSLTQQQ